VYKNLISYLYEAQQVSGDTPAIIRSLKLPLQLLVLHAWGVVGRVVAGHCQAEILFHIYMKLNKFRATHRPSSGA